MKYFLQIRHLTGNGWLQMLNSCCFIIESILVGNRIVPRYTKKQGCILNTEFAHFVNRLKNGFLSCHLPVLEINWRFNQTFLGASPGTGNLTKTFFLSEIFTFIVSYKTIKQKEKFKCWLKNLCTLKRKVHPDTINFYNLLNHNLALNRCRKPTSIAFSVHHLTLLLFFYSGIKNFLRLNYAFMASLFESFPPEEAFISFTVTCCLMLKENSHKYWNLHNLRNPIVYKRYVGFAVVQWWSGRLQSRRSCFQITSEASLSWRFSYFSSLHKYWCETKEEVIERDNSQVLE